jgi:hypothetical protein
MSQATFVGLCSDNVVTILQPSSTIECICGGGVYVDASSTSGTGLPYSIPINGAVQVSGSVTTAGAATITVGGSIFSGSGTIPFQVFATGATVILSCSDASAAWSYTISALG